jgi:hypothetical protein
MIIETILSALVPIGIEGIKQAISRFSGGVKPTTVDEQIKLEASEVERLKAVAALDSPVGTPSQWVVDLRASSRYLGALSVIALGLATLYVPGIDSATRIIALEAANIAFGFLFGSRIAAGIATLTRK